MSLSFSPRTPEAPEDKIVTGLRKFLLGLFIGMVVLTPFVWANPAFMMLIPAKVFWVSIVLLVLLVVGSLAVLRRGTISLKLSTPLVAWWAIVLVTMVSAFFSPDTMFSLVGYSFEVHSTVMLVILGLVITLMSYFKGEKSWSLYLIMGMVGAILVLALHQVLRLIFSAELLTFGVLDSAADTFVGGWNDLAILLALAVGVLLVTLVQLSLPNHLRIAVLVSVVLMLAVLGVINFALLWFGLGFFSLSLLLFVLTKDRHSTTSTAPSMLALAAIGLVTLMSLVFIVSGNAISTQISNVTNINYVEVRPSIGMTLDLTRQVLSEDLILGAGPNRFVNVWRSHRDQEINESVFWNVEFLSGNSYIFTWFITTGLLGIVAWVVFLLSFAYFGIKTLIRTENTSPLWYYIASTSFLMAASVWLIALFYVPSFVVLLYGAVATGLLLMSSQYLGMRSLVSFQLASGPRTNFLMIIMVMAVITSSVGYGYFATNQFAAQRTFASVSTITAGEGAIDDAKQRIATAHQRFPSDVFLRELVSLQILELNELLVLESPTELQQQEFQELLASTLEIAAESVRGWPQNPSNWLLFGDVYSILTLLETEGANDLAEQSYREAITLDPQNPLYLLRIASVQARAGNVEDARSTIREALNLKSNFVQAVAFLSDLEVSSGNIEEAIQASRSLILLQPRVPGLYYQLGVLYTVNENLEDAVSAFSDALLLDQQFANARFLRAVIYAEIGDTEQAIRELEAVRALDDDNTFVDEVIAAVQDENTPIRAVDFIVPAPDAQTMSQQDTILTNEMPDTDLLTPVNNVGSSDDANSENPETSDETEEDGEGDTQTDEGDSVESESPVDEENQEVSE